MCPPVRDVVWIIMSRISAASRRNSTMFSRRDVLRAVDGIKDGGLAVSHASCARLKDASTPPRAGPRRSRASSCRLRPAMSRSNRLKYLAASRAVSRRPSTLTELAPVVSCFASSRSSVSWNSMPRLVPARRSAAVTPVFAPATVAPIARLTPKKLAVLRRMVFLRSRGEDDFEFAPSPQILDLAGDDAVFARDPGEFARSRPRFGKPARLSGCRVRMPGRTGHRRRAGPALHQRQRAGSAFHGVRGRYPCTAGRPG